MPDPQLERVSERLRLAFAALATSALAGDERERLQRRLIAVTNTAKHDLGRAEAALDRVEADLASSAGGGAGADEAAADETGGAGRSG